MVKKKMSPQDKVKGHFPFARMLSFGYSYLVQAVRGKTCPFV
jgi:hypothetical protein